MLSASSAAWSERTSFGGIDLALWWRKMCKQRYDERENGTMIVRREHVLRDTVDAVGRYIKAAGLEGQPDAPLFQQRDLAGRVIDARGYPYRAFSAAVRETFSAAGVPNAEVYTGRGLRAGGHTDLYKEVQDFQLIGLLGGWKTAKSQALYLRAHRLSFSFLSEIIDG